MQALLVSGFPREDLPVIYAGKHRSPIWPNGLIGSITHSSNKAICAITNNKSSKCIGIDIEEIIPPGSASEIAHQIHNVSELDILLAAGIPPDAATTLIFSAKESLFKALYPKVKSYFGFECAKLSHINLIKRTLVLTLDKDFTQHHSIDRNYNIWFKLNKSLVKTLLLYPQ